VEARRGPGGGAHLGGQVPWDVDFVRALPALAGHYGTVSLVDEVVSGFRDAPGGWQATVGIMPDLTSLGKTVGGGLAVRALGGRAEVMYMLRPAPPPAQFPILSVAHVEEDIDQTVKALCDSLDAMIAEGSLEQSRLR
jgi:glutamate-1-semialdehyde aminotransferase